LVLNYVGRIRSHCTISKNAVFTTVDKAIPDKDLAEKLKAQLNTQLLQSSTEEIKAAASIVEAEAKSHWFVASWRPLLDVCINFYTCLELYFRSHNKNIYRDYYYI
jgi:DNA-binding transcriptional regulator PaaX